MNLLKIVRATLEAMREKLEIAGKTVTGAYDKYTLIVTGENSGYTKNLSKGRLLVSIGAGAVKGFLPDPKGSIPLEKTKEWRRKAAVAGWGINWHELGHVIATDMSFKNIMSLPPNLQGWAMRVTNIVEDPIIERIISFVYDEDFSFYKFTSPQKAFAVMKESYWLPIAAKYEDDGSVGAILNYLLLEGRVGEENIPTRNAFWDENKGFFETHLSKIRREADKKERAALQADFAVELYKLLEADPRKKDEMESISWESGKPRPVSTKAVGKDFSKEAEKALSGKASGGEAEGEGEGKGGESGESGESEDVETGKAGCGRSEEESEPIDVDDFDEFDEFLEEDSLESSAGHVWVKASEAFSISAEAEEEVRKDLVKVEPIAGDVGKFLTIFKGRKAPRWVRGRRSGRLDTRAAAFAEIRGDPRLDIFKKREAIGEIQDLAVSLVLDNSGSMSGLKSHLAALGALAVAEASDIARVPLEILAYSKTVDSHSGVAQTLEIKEFNEPLGQTLPYMAITDSEIKGVSFSSSEFRRFGGNSEETNLFYIWKRLKKINHDRKIMIVFNDGGTTGSRTALKSLVEKIIDDGIDVIGVGIGNRDVENFYPEAKTFDSEKELREELAPWLTGRLAELATEKKGEKHGR